MNNIWRWSLGGWFGEEYIADGGVLPRGYGVAWYCPYSNRAYALPVPLHRIVGSFRAWWLRIRGPCEDDPIGEAYRYGKNIGYKEGRKSGIDFALRITLPGNDMKGGQANK